MAELERFVTAQEPAREQAAANSRRTRRRPVSTS